MRVEIWSDMICPWCYLGKHRFEQALRQISTPQPVELVWRSYQLDPGAPREIAGTLNQWLAKRYGFSLAQAEGAHARLEQLGRAEGLAYDFARARPGNTLDAHRLVHLARSAASGHSGQTVTALVDRLMQGYFCQALPIGNPAELERVAIDVGLDPERVRAVLASDEFAAEVRADQNAARARNLSGVPAFVIDGQSVVSGAQSVATFVAALKQAGASVDQDQGPEANVCNPRDLN